MIYSRYVSFYQNCLSSMNLVFYSLFLFFLLAFRMLEKYLSQKNLKFAMINVINHISFIIYTKQN